MTPYRPEWRRKQRFQNKYVHWLADNKQTMRYNLIDVGTQNANNFQLTLALHLE